MSVYYGNSLVASSSFSDKAIQKLVHDVIGTRIGTLKLIATKNMKTISTDDERSLRGFDGWVYPDGRKISQKYFPLAYEKYGDRIPDLRNFFKINNTDESLGLGVVRGKNELPRHNHTIGKSSASRFGVHKAGYVWISGYDSVFPQAVPGKYFDGTEIPDSLMIHGSDTSSTSCVKRGLSMKIPSGTSTVAAIVENEGEPSGRESYPSHNLIPVLIFIGLPEL